ncbi:hypothetical protein KBY97_02645 [Synechococcus sp. ATX 2A4]|uniref:hypothetical protein n=1 Tax=Synechococcus sp. ATX 2A4 TaxID=2823727 RepID=UPI0020CC380F|nr:hypothetical protein [Synechococcus sp. ATX 2A4]MCP9884029.1 hypothetical protein [Synechococcus sp. ATX 2A4]
MTDPEPGRSPLPALYSSPWSALGRDLRAVLASLRLKAQELWRRNRQADLIVPGFWPRSLAPFFWPALLLLALLGLLGFTGGVGLLRGRSVPLVSPAMPLKPLGEIPGEPSGLQRSPARDSLSFRSSDSADPEPSGELRGMSPGSPAPSASPSPPSLPAPSLSTPPEPAPPEPTPPAIEPLLQLLADQDPQQLIRAARPHPASGTLELELAAAADRLSAQERQLQANLWLERARALGYDSLELTDGDGLLLGRPAWVGGGMILLDHQAGS